MPKSRESDLTAKELTHWVRVALTHLYDTAFLQTYPLGSLLDAEPAEPMRDDVTQAQKLRRILLDCIESLRPQVKGKGHSDAARAYTILSSRYVDGLSMDEIAGELGLSVRQIYREHERGLDAVASLFVEKYTGATWTSPDASSALQLAQVEANRLKQSIHLETIDVKAVIDDIVVMLTPLSERTQVPLQMAVTTSAPTVIALADRVLLRQALINVLRYVSGVAAAGICIEIETVPDFVQVKIKTDQETGIAPDFDPASSTCVELAVAQSLIEAQGGRIDYGRDAVVWLPIATLQRTILVIDDNADLVELFRRYLGGHQVQVVGTTDSTQAIRIATDLQPQLITVDVMMPSLDGWDVLRSLKATAETQHIPVIVCSVLNESQLAASMGASGFLSKPVKKTDLLTMTQQWLGLLMPVP